MQRSGRITLPVKTPCSEGMFPLTVVNCTPRKADRGCFLLLYSRKPSFWWALDRKRHGQYLGEQSSPLCSEDSSQPLFYLTSEQRYPGEASFGSTVPKMLSGVSCEPGTQGCTALSKTKSLSKFGHTLLTALAKLTLALATKTAWE